MRIVLMYAVVFLINPVLAMLYGLFTLQYIKINDKIRTIILPICMACSMAYIGYWIRPGKYIGDLDRYLLFQQEYDGKRLAECFDVRYKGLYSYDIFQWICAKFADPRITVFIESFIIYFSSFYIICSMAKIIGMSKRNTVGCLLLSIFLLPMYSQLSYMRSAIATSVVIMAIWRDIGLKRRDILTFLFYAIGCTFHQSAWVFVLIRLIIPLVIKMPKLVVIITVSFTALVGTGVQVFTISGGPIGNLFTMAQNYSVGEVARSTWAQGITNSNYNTISRAVFAILIVTGLIAVLNRWKKIPTEANPIMGFIIIAEAFCIGSFAFTMPVYERFTYGLIPFFSVILFAVPLDMIKKLRKITANNILILFFFLSGVLINGYLIYSNVNYKLLGLSLLQGPFVMIM